MRITDQFEPKNEMKPRIAYLKTNQAIGNVSVLAPSGAASFFFFAFMPHLD